MNNDERQGNGSSGGGADDEVMAGGGGFGIQDDHRELTPFPDLLNASFFLEPGVSPLPTLRHWIPLAFTRKKKNSIISPMHARGLFLCPCVITPRGFTSLRTQEAEYSFSGFNPTKQNNQTNPKSINKHDG